MKYSAKDANETLKNVIIDLENGVYHIEDIRSDIEHIIAVIDKKKNEKKNTDSTINSNYMAALKLVTEFEQSHDKSFWLLGNFKWWLKDKTCPVFPDNVEERDV